MATKKDHGKAGGRESPTKSPILRQERRKQALSVFGGAVPFVLPSAIGTVEVVDKVPTEIVRVALITSGAR